MKKTGLNKLMALFLAAIMVFTTVIPMNVSATESGSSTYHSQVYSVNGIPAFAYDGADLSQGDVTFRKMEDNKTLAKALYYSYGALGYSKEYAAIDVVYSKYGAKSATDKLAVSEMVLTKIMGEDESLYDAMTKSFLEAIASLSDCDSAFTPYYILLDGDVVGYTSASTEKYEMPEEETTEEASTEEAIEESTSETATEDVSSEEITEENTEETTEEIIEETEDNLQNPDGTYKDGIRNRNKGTLSSKLGDIDTETVLTEIDKHWSDDTYFGRNDYANGDFVATLLSNISGKKIDTNIMKFANDNNLEVYQFSGTSADVTKAVLGLQYPYCSIGDVVVVTHDNKEYCGIYVELAFYQKSLDKANKHCMYNPVPDYSLDSEFDANGNEFAWVWYDGETTKLTPLEFDGNITLSVIQISRDMSITAEGQGYQDLGDGAVLYQETDKSGEFSEGESEEGEEDGLVANSWEQAFTRSSDQISLDKNKYARRGSYMTSSDGRHATMYYRVIDSDSHKNCKGSHPEFEVSGTKRTYCSSKADSKSKILITCGEAKLLSVASTSQWNGGTLQIQNYNKPSIDEDCDIHYASSKYSGTRLNTSIMVNPGAFVNEKFTMSYCRDSGSSVPGSSSDGYYELYLQNCYVSSGKIYYTFNMLWYQDARLLKKTSTQRLCTTFTLAEPVVNPKTPQSANGKLSIQKKASAGGTLADGTYRFQLLNSAKAVIDTQDVVVTNGVSSVAEFNIANCFNYTAAGKAGNGAPQYNVSCETTYYLQETAAPPGMTCDTNKLTPVTIGNLSEYQTYLRCINEENIASYNNEACTSTNMSVPTPVFSSTGSTYTIVSNSQAYYVDSEVKSGVGFTKMVDSSCASIVQGNPNYSLADAEYGVYTDAACTQLATWYETLNYTALTQEQDVLNYTSPTEAVFHTNADGSFKEHTTVVGNPDLANIFVNRVCMEPGTYWIKELKAPMGYKLNPEKKQFTIEAGKYDNSVVVTDEVVIDPFSISFSKKLTGGLADIAGVSVTDATFKLEYFTDAALTNKKYEASFRVGNDERVLFTKDSAFNSTFPDDCWKGKREAQQLHLPAGYIRVTENNNDTNENVGTLCKAVIKLNDGTTVDISNGVVFQVKYTSDANTREEFICITANNTVVDENTVEQVEDERVKRFDICFRKEDQNGEPMSNIPFIIENTKTGEKHLVVSDDNGFVTTRRTDSVTVDGDSSKTLDDYKSADAPYYNSLDSYIESDISKMTDSDIVKNKLRPAPIWFYGTTEDVSKVDSFVAERDTDVYHGSLIYADAKDYVIYEVPTEKSNDKQLVEKGDIKFGCTRDGDVVKITDGRLNGVVTNYDRQKIKTLSRDAATQSRFTKQSATSTVIDNFTVTNLKYNHSYTVKGVLVARNTTIVGDTTFQAGELIKDSDGKYITAHSAFTTNQTADDGAAVADEHTDSRKDKTYTSYDTDADGKITAQTSLVYNFNTEDFAACNAVWYTYLCEGIEGADGVDLVITDDGQIDKEASNVMKAGVISEENQYYDYVEDEELTNDKEFVDVVCISTEAFTETFGTANETVSKETEIFDTVIVNGLVEGVEYQLVSKLANPETGEILVDADGNEIIGKLDGTTDKFTYTKDENGGWRGIVKYPKIDTTPFAGKSIVCLQYLYDADGVLVGESTKLTNDKETIHFPTVETEASGHEGEKLLCQYGEVEINDEVKYQSLSLNKEYEIVGTLHYVDKDGNEGILHHKDGSEIKSSVTFTPTKPDETTGSVVVPFKFDVSDVLEDVYSWQQTVVFEDLYHDGKIIVSHADIKDRNQTVLYPGIHTSLRDGETGVQHVKTFDKDLVLVDTVSYTNLKIGKTYRIIGKLINSETGEVLKNGDKEVVGTAVFTPEKNGDEFKCEMSSGKSDKSSDDGTTGDDSQADSTDVSTNTAGSTDAASETSTDANEDSRTVRTNSDSTDTSASGNTGDDIFKDYVSGTVEVKFEFNGKDAGLIAEDGHHAQIVAYEYLYDDFDMKSATLDKTEDGYVDLYDNVKLWSKHNDISDIEQTMTAPTGQTTFTDNVTEAHVATVNGVITTTDRISYRGLLKGKTYVATGTLYIPKDQATDAELLLVEKDENGNECCPLLDENGKKIQGSTTFVAETPDGEVDVSFTFSRSLITKTKKQIVAFEEVSIEQEGVVFTHKSITDTDQTLRFPEVHTTALSEDTKDHLAGAYPKATIIDTVQVSNLEPNRKFKLVGTLINQADGTPIMSDGKAVSSEVEFESETDKEVYDGTVDVTFEFDASVLLAGQTTVVFEKLYIKKVDKDGKETEEWVECGSHEDIDDEGQTVHFSDLHTTALGQSTKKHNVPCDKKVTIVDSVAYSNLIPGKQYKISGLLMAIPEDMKATDLDMVEVEDGKKLSDYTVKYYPDKNLYIDINGYKCKPLLVNGKTITSEITFTPTEPNGTVDVTFTFDASKLEGRTLVVFEDLYNDQNILVGSHADITDKGQTIKVKKPQTPGDIPPSIETGDNFPLALVIVLTFVFLAGIIGLLLLKKKFFK